MAATDTTHPPDLTPDAKLRRAVAEFLASPAPFPDPAPLRAALAEAQAAEQQAVPSTGEFRRIA